MTYQSFNPFQSYIYPACLGLGGNPSCLTQGVSVIIMGFFTGFWQEASRTLILMVQMHKLFSLPAARRNLKQKLQEHRLQQMRTTTFSTQWKIHFQLKHQKLGMRLVVCYRQFCHEASRCFRGKRTAFLVIEIATSQFKACVILAISHPLDRETNTSHYFFFGIEFHHVVFCCCIRLHPLEMICLM